MNNELINVLVSMEQNQIQAGVIGDTVKKVKDGWDNIWDKANKKSDEDLARTNGTKENPQPQKQESKPEPQKQTKQSEPQQQAKQAPSKQDKKVAKLSKQVKKLKGAGMRSAGIAAGIGAVTGYVGSRMSRRPSDNRQTANEAINVLLAMEQNQIQAKKQSAGYFQQAAQRFLKKTSAGKALAEKAFKKGVKEGSKNRLSYPMAASIGAGALGVGAIGGGYLARERF